MWCLCYILKYKLTVDTVNIVDGVVVTYWDREIQYIVLFISSGWCCCDVVGRSNKIHCAVYT